MKVFAEVRVHGYGRGAGDMDRVAAINVVMVRVGRIYFKNVTIGLNALPNSVDLYRRRDISQEPFCNMSDKI